MNSSDSEDKKPEKQENATKAEQNEGGESVTQDMEKTLVIEEKTRGRLLEKRI